MKEKAMLVGQYFMRFGAGVTQYSPSFPRGGEAAVFSIEILALISGTSITLAVEHKNLEDTNWGSLGNVNATSVGVWPLSVTGLKEEVRLTYVVGGNNDTDTVYANVLAPQWRPF
jgi:hypothetical protein